MIDALNRAAVKVLSDGALRQLHDICWRLALAGRRGCDREYERQRPLLLGAVADAIATLLLAVDLKRHGRGREGALLELLKAKVQPVLTIESGGEITIKTTSCGSETVPDRSCFHVSPDWPRFMPKANGWCRATS